MTVQDERRFRVARPLVCSSLLAIATLLTSCQRGPESVPGRTVRIQALSLPEGPQRAGSIVTVRSEISGKPTAVQWMAAEGVFYDPRARTTQYVMPDDISSDRDVAITLDVWGPDGLADRRRGTIRVVPSGPPEIGRRP